MRETVLDWKPFDSFTVEQNSGPLGVVEATYQFDSLEEKRTRLSMRLKGHMPKLPAFLNPAVFKFIYTRILNYQVVARRMRAAIDADIAVPTTEASTPTPSAH